MNQVFDHIYVLYITDHELKRAQYKLNKKNATVEYFLGVDGKTLINEFNKQTCIKTPGAYGHIHSMINIITDAINNNYTNILILEPDIYFSCTFDKEILKVKQLKYKLLYIGASQHKWSTRNKHIGPTYLANETYGTFAIALNKSILSEYLDILCKKLSPSDTCLLTLQRKYYNDCHVMNPNLIICDVTHSTTASAATKRNQVEYMNRLRWGNIYVIEDMHVFAVEPGFIHEINVYLDSYRKEKQGYVKIGDTVVHLPDQKYKNAMSDYYRIFHMPHELTIAIYTNNLYIKTIQVKKVIF